MAAVRTPIADRLEAARAKLAALHQEWDAIQANNPYGLRRVHLALEAQEREIAQLVLAWAKAQAKAQRSPTAGPGQ